MVFTAITVSILWGLFSVNPIESLLPPILWGSLTVLVGVASRRWYQVLGGACLGVLWFIPMEPLQKLIAMDLFIVLATFFTSHTNSWQNEAKIKIIIGQLLPLLGIVLISSMDSIPGSTLLIAALIAIKVGILPWQRFWVDVLNANGVRASSWLLHLYRYAVFSWYIQSPWFPAVGDERLALVSSILALLTSCLLLMQSNLRRFQGYYLCTCHAMALSYAFIGRPSIALLLVVFAGLILQLFEEFLPSQRSDRWDDLFGKLYHPAAATTLLLSALAPLFPVQLIPWDTITRYSAVFTFLLIAYILMVYKLVKSEYLLSITRH